MRHAAIDTLGWILAAGEPSKVPFFVSGALLAAWAVVLSAIGLMRPDFPDSRSRERAVMALSAALVLATVVAAVATSTKEGEERAAEAAEGGAEPATRAGAPAGALVLAADPGGQLAFDRQSLTAKAGKVTIAFANPSAVPHDVTVERGTRKLAATPAITEGRATLAVDLEPGSYAFYCSVDGHRQSGMEGTLTVQ